VAVRAGATPADEPGDEPRPNSLNPQQLGFRPRRPVPWLSPVLLAGTAVRVILSELFGAYLDKRELQNALPRRVFDERRHTPDGQHDDAAEVWFDYVADVGDGFHPTYSIAYLLAQPSLAVAGRSQAGAAGGILPRGRMLVMGGDQVYPTASGQQYEDRFKGPYRAALPQRPHEGHQPTMYALPGNHDWYDGLTAFLRVFARAYEGKVGGWRTRQSRSYFAIQLPHRWWLFGIDTQGDAYIDDPQLRYFEEAAQKLTPGDRVILCTPNPSWVEAAMADDPHAYDAVDYFVRKIIAPTGAHVRVMLSGDLHHYARYSAPDRELITCGGGGAYLFPTHGLPEHIHVPPKATIVRKASSSQRFNLMARFPSAGRSRALAAGVFARMPWRNPAFVAFLGLAHLLLMLAMANAAHRPVGTELQLVTIPVGLMVALVLFGNIMFAMPPTAGRRRLKHWMLGTAHGLAHVALGLLGTWLWLRTPFVDLPYPLPLIMAALLYLPASGLVVSQLVSMYLLVAAAFRVNMNELFAGQGIIDAKAFLRLHIGGDGALTIYPIAVDRVSRRWIARPDEAADRPWFEPAHPMPVHLVEDPIRVE
jgi:hypothetical protein